jgi:hypothetical protein
MKASLLSLSSRVTGRFGVVHVAGVALGLSLLACEPGGVGDPCTPEDEYEPSFSGYGLEEVNVESKSFQCETRLCLVNHFQGRVSCPYGQSEADVTSGNPQCFIPGTQDQVNKPVEPQKTNRRPNDAVYCSCRCANKDGSKDDGARYCECPSGYDCEKLIDFTFGEKDQLAGYYCIKQGTRYTGFSPGECDRSISNCDGE